jgi:nitroreductase
MVTQQHTTRPGAAMSLIEAIYQRRSVRNYTQEKVSKDVILDLLDAAVHAPTAMHEEPWSFVVIQDKSLLNQLSDEAKELVINEARLTDSEQSRHMMDIVARPDFNIFYNSQTLILICSKFPGPFVQADCWLAAENLVLAACAIGLSTCVIGFAISVLNTPEWKSKLGIPSETAAVVPVIVGYAADDTAPVSRKSPEIIVWK